MQNRFWFIFVLATVTCLAAPGCSHGEGDESQHSADDHVTHEAHGTFASTDGATHGEHPPVNPNPLTLDPDLSIVTAIVFGLLLLVLAKFAWNPIIEALERREQGVAKHLDDAKAIHEDAKKFAAGYEQKLASAADEVRSMLEEARRDADATKQRIVAEAQEAAAAERTRALREIELAKYDALHELRQNSVDLAFGLARNVVKKELNSADHANLIQEALEKLPTH